MIDEDELDEVEEGLVDLAMRGWRTLDEHPLDPRSKRVQLEHNELSTLPKTIGTLEFMWKLDVSHNRLEALPRTIGKCTRLRILNVDHNYLEDIPKVRSRRPVVLRRLHAVDATRVHQTRSWVVSFSILRPFGPILRAGHRVGRVRARARRDSRGGRCSGVPRPRHAPGLLLAVADGHQEAAQGGQVGALQPQEGQAF